MFTITTEKITETINENLFLPNGEKNYMCVYGDVVDDFCEIVKEEKVDYEKIYQFKAPEENKGLGKNVLSKENLAKRDKVFILKVSEDFANQINFHNATTQNREKTRSRGGYVEIVPRIKTSNKKTIFSTFFPLGGTNKEGKIFGSFMYLVTKIKSHSNIKNFSKSILVSSCDDCINLLHPYSFFEKEHMFSHEEKDKKFTKKNTYCW